MLKLVPFKLDPIFRAGFNPTAPCADCGRVVEFRYARIVTVDISEKKEDRPQKEVSLDEFARNTVWTILCPECRGQQSPGERTPEKIQ